MGHVNDDYGFVQLYPVGIDGISDQSGIKKQEIVEVNSAADLQKHCTSCCPAVVF